MPSRDNQPEFDHLLPVRPHGRLVRALDREARAERKSTRAGTFPNPLETFASIRPLIQQMMDEHRHEVYMHYTMLTGFNAVYQDLNPGTTYVTFDDVSGSGLPGIHTNFDVDFRLFEVTYARVIISGAGNDASGTKGIRIVDDVDFNTLCEVEWTTTVFQPAIAGDWTPVNTALWNNQKELLIRVRGGTADDDIVIRRVDLQLRGYTLRVSSDIPPD